MHQQEQSTHITPVERILVGAIGDVTLCLVGGVLVGPVQRVGQLDGQTFLVLLRLVFTHPIQHGRRVRR